MIFQNTLNQSISAGAITFEPMQRRILNGIVLDAPTMKALGTLLGLTYLLPVDDDAKRLMNLQKLDNSVFNIPDNVAPGDGLTQVYLKARDTPSLVTKDGTVVSVQGTGGGSGASIMTNIVRQGGRVVSYVENGIAFKITYDGTGQVSSVTKA